MYASIQHFIIGGHEINNDGIWSWVDGAPFDYQAWAPGQPNNGQGTQSQDCLVSGPNGWHDVQCNVTYDYKYMCRRNLTLGT